MESLAVVLVSFALQGGLAQLLGPEAIAGAGGTGGIVPGILDGVSAIVKAGAGAPAAAPANASADPEKAKAAAAGAVLDGVSKMVGGIFNGVKGMMSDKGIQAMLGGGGGGGAPAAGTQKPAQPGQQGQPGAPQQQQQVQQPQAAPQLGASQYQQQPYQAAQG